MFIQGPTFIHFAKFSKSYAYSLSYVYSELKSTYPKEFFSLLNYS